MGNNTLQLVVLMGLAIQNQVTNGICAAVSQALQTLETMGLRVRKPGDQNKLHLKKLVSADKIGESKMSLGFQQGCIGQVISLPC
ncbi:MAG: hypothetical protein AAF483_28455 [Planctomycetota bacterium]